eukprot:jgi/Hompol1/2556/HPOL_006048-RA
MLAYGLQHISAALNSRKITATRKAEPSTSQLPVFADHLSLDAFEQTGDHGAASDEYTKALLGAHLVPCQVLADVDDTLAMFFVFHDLGIRSPGQYMLKCRVMDMNNCSTGHPGSEHSSMDTVAYLQTPVFGVYAPKYYPGTPDKTELSIKLAQQGVL